jgi:hypothetical protein
MLLLFDHAHDNINGEKMEEKGKRKSGRAEDPDLTNVGN